MTAIDDPHPKPGKDNNMATETLLGCLNAMIVCEIKDPSARRICEYLVVQYALLMP